MLVVGVASQRKKVSCRFHYPKSSCPCAEGPVECRVLCFQDGGTQKLEKAKISLDDCLACSGCVTSAETVLITQQSHEELRKVLDANKVSGGRSWKLF